MGQGLTTGKPLLGKGKILPPFAVDVPGHVGSYLIGGLFSLFQDGKDFFIPYIVVFLQLGNPSPVMGKDLAMSRQDLSDVVVVYFIQALEVGFKGIVIFRPEGDIRSDALQNVVAGEEYFFIRFIETHMPPGMAGGLYALEGIISNFNLISLPEKGHLKVGPGMIPASRMFTDRRLDVRFRKPIDSSRIRHFLPVVGIADDFGVGVIEIDLR